MHGSPAENLSPHNPPPLTVPMIWHDFLAHNCREGAFRWVMHRSLFLKVPFNHPPIACTAMVDTDGLAGTPGKPQNGFTLIHLYEEQLWAAVKNWPIRVANPGGYLWLTGSELYGFLDEASLLACCARNYIVLTPVERLQLNLHGKLFWPDFRNCGWVMPLDRENLDLLRWLVEEGHLPPGTTDVAQPDDLLWVDTHSDQPSQFVNTRCYVIPAQQAHHLIDLGSLS